MKKELELKEKRLKHKMKRIRYTIEENNNVMSRYDHKIETSLEGIEHLSIIPVLKREIHYPVQILVLRDRNIFKT